MDSINTERSYTEYEVNEPTTDFAIGFDNYSGEDKDAIHVTLDGVNLDNLDYTVVRKNAQVIEVTPAIESGVVRLQRETYIDQAFHKFTAGALFSPKSMDENFAQVRRSQQEVNDGFTFLAENTNGVVQASKEATAQAKAATVEATASAVRAESAADTAVQAVGSLQGVVDAASTATTKAKAATATATTAASQATAATTTAQNAAQAAMVAKQEAATATAAASAAAVDTLAATGRAIEAAKLAENTDVAQLQLDLESQKLDTGIIATAKFGGIERTQAKKNSDVVDAKDFGILPDILDDQTSKFDLFLDYLRSSKKEGFISAGTYVVSPNKKRTFGSEVVNYCLDISGVSLRGAVGGYRNTSGTILVQNTDFPADIETTVMMLQAQQNLPNIQCRISGFAARNTGVVLRLTYSVHSDVSHLYWDKTCVNGIILGEFTFASGALFNKFSNFDGHCQKRPIQLRGKDWCNANVFENFYVTGNEPSSIECLGGYGALANVFLGGEFASRTGSNACGITLKNVASTTFYSTYFESYGEAVQILGTCRKLHFSNVVIGTTQAASTVAHSLVYHSAGSASVTFTGGSVYLNTVGLQDNMRLIKSAQPANLELEVLASPFVLTGNTLGWKLVDLSEAVTYRKLHLAHYTETTPITFSSAGASITNLKPASKVTYTFHGSAVHVYVDMLFQPSTVLGEGDYYIQLLTTPTERRLGTATYTSGAGLTAGTCAVSTGNKNMFIYTLRTLSEYSPETGVVSSTTLRRPINKTELGTLPATDGRVEASIQLSIN